MKEITDGKGVDVVYNSIGKDTFPKSLDCLKPRGLWVSFGNASGPVPAFDISILAQKGVAVRDAAHDVHLYRQARGARRECERRNGHDPVRPGEDQHIEDVPDVGSGPGPPGPRKPRSKAPLFFSRITPSAAWRRSMEALAAMTDIVSGVPLTLSPSASSASGVLGHSINSHIRKRIWVG